MSPRTLALRALGLVLLVTGVALTPASAAVPAGSLVGLSADLGSVEIHTDGTSISELVVTGSEPPVANECNPSASGIAAPVGGGAFRVGNAIEDASGRRTDLEFAGFIDASGFGTGSFRALPTVNNPCATRSSTWAVVPSPGSAVPTPNVSFTGTTDKGGAVSFRTTSGGGVTAMNVVLPGGCRPFANPSGPANALTNGVARIAATDGAGFVFLMLSGGRAVGAYATPRVGGAGCESTVGTFTASVAGAPSPSPTAPLSVPAAGPAPAAPPSAAPVIGAIPRSQASALLVTGRQTTAEELVNHIGAAGCNVIALGALEAQAWRIYINGAPVPVNSAFPISLGPNRPFYLRCGAS